MIIERVFMDGFDYKLVVVTREDLELSVGKLAVQVAHAAVMCANECRKTNAKWYSRWLQEGQKKVVVSVENIQELQELEKKAFQLKIPNAMVIDAGLTEIPYGTTTCLGIGPGPNSEIDKITGKLPLL